jgi:hypothetical protein
MLAVNQRIVKTQPAQAEAWEFTNTSRSTRATHFDRIGSSDHRSADHRDDDSDSRFSDDN